MTNWNLKEKEIDEKAITKILKELEFNQLGKRILGKPIYQEKQMDLFAGSEIENISDPTFQTFTSIKPSYQLIEKKDDHIKLINKLLSQEAVAFDTETTSLDINEAQLLGISFLLFKKKRITVIFPKINR